MYITCAWISEPNGYNDVIGPTFLQMIAVLIMTQMSHVFLVSVFSAHFEDSLLIYLPRYVTVKEVSLHTRLITPEKRGRSVHDYHSV